MIEVSMRYCDERSRAGKEPAWTKTLPISARTFCRLNYALTEEDTLVNVPRFSHTGISYAVICGGLCEATAHTFNVWRLSYIKQLGFLQAPYYGEEGKYTYLKMPLSDGTRLLHSFDVTAIASIMAYNNRLSELATNHLRAAALSHDMATPAGGDSVKLVDFQALDEDINYPAITKTLDWKQMKRFGVQKKLLSSTVQGKGVLGEFLDIADKLAYVARDLEKCWHHLAVGLEADQLGLKTLTGLVERHPYVCGVWDSVVIKDDHPCFTDVVRLVAFLKVRVLMFRELYYHPVSRFGEYFVSRLLVRTLYEQGKLTKADLLKMTDNELVRRLDEEFGTGPIIDVCTNELAKCESFKTIEEAQAFRKRLQDAGNLFTMLDDDRRMIKTGINLRMYTRRGAKPLHEVDPASAQELKEMATMLPLVKVYYLDGEPDLPPEKLKKLMDYLRVHPMS